MDYYEEVSLCPSCGLETLKFNTDISKKGTYIQCGNCNDEWLPFELASMFVAKKGKKHVQCRCPSCGVNSTNRTESDLEHAFVTCPKGGSHGEYAGYCFDCGYSSKNLTICETCKNPFLGFHDKVVCEICGDYDPYEGLDDDEEDEYDNNTTDAMHPREAQDMVRKMEIFLDGKKLTKEKARHEAKNFFGVGDGVALLANELVGNRFVGNDEHLYQSDKKAYFQNAVTRGVYDLFLAGSVMLKHIEDSPEFFDELVALLDTKPHSEVVGHGGVSKDGKVTAYTSMTDIEACKALTDDVALKLQEMIENTNMEGSFEYSDSKNLILEYVENDGEPITAQEPQKPRTDTLRQIEVLFEIARTLYNTLPSEFLRTYKEASSAEDLLEAHIQGGIKDIREMRMVHAKLTALSEHGEFDEDNMHFCDQCAAIVENVLSYTGKNGDSFELCETCFAHPEKLQL